MFTSQLGRKSFIKGFHGSCQKFCNKKLYTLAMTTPLTGHGGIFKTINRIYERYWWPTCNKDVNEYIQKCDVCQKAREKQHQLKIIP